MDLPNNGFNQATATVSEPAIETNLNASMTYEDTGDAPTSPGCQDSETLFLVTSVT